MLISIDFVYYDDEEGDNNEYGNFIRFLKEDIQTTNIDSEFDVYLKEFFVIS